MDHTSEKIIRRRRLSVRFCRGIVLLAGLLLASTYFMPAIDCDDDPRVNPSQEVRHLVKREIRSPPPLSAWPVVLVNWLAHYVVYVAAYLFGLLAALGAVARLSGRRTWQQGVVWLTFLMFLFTAASIFYCSLSDYEMWVGYVVFSFRHAPCESLVTPLGALVYACWVMRLRERALLCLAFMGASVCLLRFVRWENYLWADPVYGLHWALFATAVLLCAVVVETARVTRVNLRFAFVHLLAGRLLPFVRDDGCCPACGYNLYGAGAARCPECGRAFQATEVGRTYAELGIPTPPPATPPPDDLPKVSADDSDVG